MKSWVEETFGVTIPSSAIPLTIVAIIVAGLIGPWATIAITTHRLSLWAPWVTIPLVLKHPAWVNDWRDLSIGILIGAGYLIFQSGSDGRVDAKKAHGAAELRTARKALTADWVDWDNPDTLPTPPFTLEQTIAPRSGYKNYQQAAPDSLLQIPKNVAPAATTNKHKGRNKTASMSNSNGTPPGGLLVGLMPNKSTALVLTRDQNMLVLGATRSGKTSSLIFESIGMLAENNQSMIISDIKGELYRRTAAFLQQLGYAVIRYDLREPGRGDQINPLDTLVQAFHRGRYDQMVQYAWKLVDALVDKGGNGEQPFWRNAKTSLLVALMLYVVSVPLTQRPNDSDNQPNQSTIHLANVLQLLSIDDEILDGLIQSEATNKENPVGSFIQQAYATIAKAAPETRGSIVSDTAAQLRLWARPDIAWFTARTTPWEEFPKRPPIATNLLQDKPPATETGPFQWTDIGNAQKPPVAIFLVVPHNDTSSLPIGTMILTQMLQALGDAAVQAPQGRLSRQVNFLLDEFGNFPAIPDMDKVASLGLGQGIRLMLIIQDYSQIEKNYDNDASRTIISNCGTQCYLKTNEHESAERFSNLLGDQTVSDYSTSQSYGHDASSSSRSRSASFISRPLKTPDELMRNPLGTVIVYQEAQMPAELRLKPIQNWPRYANVFADRAEEYVEMDYKEAPASWPTTQLSEEEQPGDAVSLEDLFAITPLDQFQLCNSDQEVANALDLYIDEESACTVPSLHIASTP